MAATDHRTRVAAERRERMRVHLIDTAVQLLAASGPDALSIDDIVQSAGVARGTFYNYFTAPADLMRAVGTELAEDLITTVDPIVKAYSDPAERVAVGIRAILGCARASPVLAAIIMQSGWPAAATDHALHRVTARDIALGLRTRRFRPIAIETAMALLGGLTVGVMPAFAKGTPPTKLEQQVAETLLLGLGLPAKEAERIARAPVAMVHPKTGGLFARLLAVRLG